MYTLLYSTAYRNLAESVICVVAAIWHVEVAKAKHKLGFAKKTFSWFSYMCAPPVISYNGSFQKIQTLVRTQSEALFIADLLHRITHKEHILVDPPFSRQEHKQTVVISCQTFSSPNTPIIRTHDKFYLFGPYLGLIHFFLKITQCLLILTYASKCHFSYSRIYHRRI